MKGNARIRSTHLGYEDHGIGTIFLKLEQGGSGQGFGGYGLGFGQSHDLKVGEGTCCALWIKRILDVVGVERWEDLPGKYVRVAGEDFGKIEGIGNIVEDMWFYPEKEWEALNEDQG